MEDLDPEVQIGEAETVVSGEAEVHPDLCAVGLLWDLEDLGPEDPEASLVDRGCEVVEALEDHRWDRTALDPL